MIRRNASEAKPAGSGNIEMAANASSDHLARALQDAFLALVRRDGRDLPMRQLGIFLICYLQEGPHTIRGLAAELNCSRPAISHALDRLEELDLARRTDDPAGRGSILVRQTLHGAAFLRELRCMMARTSSTPVLFPRA
jgi:DNA-binding MarR family transcriptional regulator